MSLFFMSMRCLGPGVSDERKRRGSQEEEREPQAPPGPRRNWALLERRRTRALTGSRLSGGCRPPASRHLFPLYSSAMTRLLHFLAFCKIKRDDDEANWGLALSPFFSFFLARWPHSSIFLSRSLKKKLNRPSSVPLQLWRPPGPSSALRG